MVDYRSHNIRKVLIKISGEFLAGDTGYGFCPKTISNLVEDIIQIKTLGISVAVVLGGGNLYRGATNENKISRIVGDNIGMLATIQNALAVSDYLSKKNVGTDILSALKIDKVAKFYTPSRALTSLREGKICFLCGGTGNPYFTTDTAAVLRGIEIKADLILKGTKVDGIYSSDPQKDKNAKLYNNLSYEKALNDNLKVMDITAFSLAKSNNMYIKVFNVTQPGNLKKAILEKDFGTLVYNANKRS